MRGDLTTWTDADLLGSIMAWEHAIRSDQERLSRLNAEWHRRHVAGPCPADCREPHAREGTYA